MIGHLKQSPWTYPRCDGKGVEMTTTSEMELEFNELEHKIDRLKKAERELNTLGDPEFRGLFRKEIGSIMAKVKDPKSVDEVERELATLKEKLEPSITVFLSRTDFEPDTWSDVDLVVQNTSSATARSIAVSMPDSVAVSGLKEVTSLSGGEEMRMAVRLRPREKGRVPVSISISFGDMNGISYTQEQIVDLQVEPKSGAETPDTIKPPPYFPAELLTIYSSPELIGRGGFARVFRTQRKKDGVEVAVKVPLDLDPVIGKSFLKEIENWQKLDHDNITRLLDFNILPAVYMEMELCQRNLGELTKPLMVEKAACIAMEVARGLGHAHHKGIIHRDLKPSNILIKDDIYKISDWGLSRVKSKNLMSTSVKSTSMSFSPLYAAPEQYSPKTFGRSDERTDIFLLGIVLYELVTGELPFTGEDLNEISYAITNETPGFPSEVNPEAKAIEPIILNCLQKNKDDRYANVVELQTDLADFLGMDFKKSLTRSESRIEKIKLCTDLVEIYGNQGDCHKCLIYLKNLQSFVSGSALKEVIQEEISALEFYARQEVSMADRAPRIEEVVHRARMGE